MRKLTLIILSLLIVLCGCGKTEETVSTTVFTDALGREVALTSNKRVISAYGSFAEVWTLAGGTLVGVTEDAISERQLELGDDVAIIGSVKAPDLEFIISLEPDFLILSADIAPHVSLDEALTNAGITHAYFRTDTFEQYLEMLNLFCSLTGREDLYKANGTDIKDKIDSIISAVQSGEKRPSVLLIRAFSTGAKAKGADNPAGVILEDLNTDNIVERHNSLLEDLSIEEIIAEDPDYIFVSTMGSDDKALAALAEGIASNPAWKDLSAVKNGRYNILPKELFHYKPNAKWAESYEYIAKIIYPEITA